MCEFYFEVLHQFLKCVEHELDLFKWRCSWNKNQRYAWSSKLYKLVKWKFQSTSWHEKNFQFAKNGQIYKSFTLRDLIAWYSRSQLEIFVRSMYNYNFKTLFLPILAMALDQTKRKGNVFAPVIEYDISHWFLSNYIL